MIETNKIKIRHIANGRGWTMKDAVHHNDSNDIIQIQIIEDDAKYGTLALADIVSGGGYMPVILYTTDKGQSMEICFAFETNNHGKWEQVDLLDLLKRFEPRAKELYPGI